MEVVVVTTETTRGLSPEVLAERWRMASTDVRLFGDETVPSEVNSEPMVALLGAARMLAARMVHGLSPEAEVALDLFEDRFASMAERELCAFADKIEAVRLERQMGVAR